MRFLLILACLLASVSTGANSQSVSCNQFSQENCLRFDVPSARAGENIPRGSTNRPSGGLTMAALQAGTVQPAAGSRSLVFIVWGLGSTPVSALRAYQHRLPHADVVPIQVEEVSPTTAPRFDPEYAPPGPARAFKVTYTGGMVSLQVPRSAISPGTIMLLCPDGQSVYPDRSTVRNRVRSQEAMRFTAFDMHRWAHEQRNGRPRWFPVTTEPVLW